MAAERLQKILSQSGIASRRAAEELIAAGRVVVNGHAVRELGARADLAVDRVTVDGRRVYPATIRRTIVLHKPRGIVSTLADPEGRPTVRDLVRGIKERLVPVGRLDLQTTGVLLMTNDGDLVEALLHPRNGVERVYEVKVDGLVTERTLARMREPIRAPGGLMVPVRVRVLERLPTKTWLEVTVTEGRHHLVRRLCAAAGHPVDKLTRTRFGIVAVRGLPPGAWRDLTPGEHRWLAAALRVSGRDAAAPGGTRRERGPSPKTRRPRGERAR